jgi:CDP-diacylglycerol--glycerol-3-phosphate 3-phosphatidyltransferase
VAINAYARVVTDRAIIPIAKGLVRVGATPDWMTVFGLVLIMAGVVIVLLGENLTGGIVMGVGAIIDAFDGAVARERGSSGKWGAFLDSVTDRVADGVILGTAAWLVRDEPVAFGAALVALIAAQLTSYIRAKAESLGFDATVGIIERPERMLIVIPAIAFGYLKVGLYVLAAGSVVTVAQRLRVVWVQARP